MNTTLAHHPRFALADAVGQPHPERQADDVHGEVREQDRLGLTLEIHGEGGEQHEQRADHRGAQRHQREPGEQHQERAVAQHVAQVAQGRLGRGAHHAAFRQPPHRGADQQRKQDQQQKQ